MNYEPDNAPHFEVLYPKHASYLLRLVSTGSFPTGLLVVTDSRSIECICVAFLTRLLLCVHGTACGACVGCGMERNNTHPDLFRIDTAPLPIKIDDAAYLRRHLSSKPVFSLRRVGTVLESHRMTIAAANSLLKLIEDASSKTAVILSTTYPQLIPSTIQSRVQQLFIPSLEEEYTHSAVELENRREQYAFWEQFIRATTIERHALADARLDHDSIASNVESLHRVLHRRLHAHPSEAKETAAALEVVQELHHMLQSSVNKKMIIDFLITSL